MTDEQLTANSMRGAITAFYIAYCGLCDLEPIRLDTALYDRAGAVKHLWQTGWKYTKQFGWVCSGCAAAKKEQLNMGKQCVNGLRCEADYYPNPQVARNDIMWVFLRDVKSGPDGVLMATYQPAYKCAEWQTMPAEEFSRYYLRMDDH